jgi:hypothetical protein
MRIQNPAVFFMNASRISSTSLEDRLEHTHLETLKSAEEMDEA